MAHAEFRQREFVGRNQSWILSGTARGAVRLPGRCFICSDRAFEPSHRSLVQTADSYTPQSIAPSPTVSVDAPFAARIVAHWRPPSRGLASNAGWASSGLGARPSSRFIVVSAIDD